MRQAPDPYKRFFKKEGEKLPPVVELDGSVARDFFTALCVGELILIEIFMFIMCEWPNM